jgi:non-canonical poly(A) RNA polymerase PAPD5/7
MQVIPSAKVPIIKFDDISSGLAFDISFDVANGPKTAKLVTELMGSLAPMRHLVIVLKLFLQQREMNEVHPPTPSPPPSLAVTGLRRLHSS